MDVQGQIPPRIFLDAGVVIDGVINRWGSARGVLIIAAMRSSFRAVIAAPVEGEIVRNIDKIAASLSVNDARDLRAGLNGWFQHARPERLPWPTDQQLTAHAHLLAAVRHTNDMPAVVAAVLARPDWILSTNTDHWNQELSRRTGLRIAHPATFLMSLHL